MILTQERAHTINGVEGRMFSATARDTEAPGAFCSQVWKSSRPIDGWGAGARITVTLRFDDECRNGRNTFGMTAEIKRPTARDFDACGCLHDEIASVFPELSSFIPWHLVSSDGPIHYATNAVYLAGDRDCWGLRKGERVPLKTARGAEMWELQAVTGGPHGGVKLSDTPTGLEYAGRETVPLFILENRFNRETYELLPATPLLKWIRSERIGEGKERELDKARAAAIWPDATDEELCQDPAALRAALEARLPALMGAFKAAIAGAGFMWEREGVPA